MIRTTIESGRRSYDPFLMGGGGSFFLPKWLGGRLDDSVNLLEEYP